VNAAQFNTRTRALNNVLYWSAQMFAAVIFGYALDMTRFRRTTRAKACWLVLFVLTFVIFGGGYDFQKGYTRAEVNKGADTPKDPSDDYVKMDWTTSGYVGPMFLYIFYVSPVELRCPEYHTDCHEGFLRRCLAMQRLLVHGRYDEQ
jgi:hypothetical protein